MSRSEPPKPKLDLTFYPAYCYSASPTWSKWVKLTCWDVHNALRPHQQQGKSYTSGSNAALTLFYLNHPIQYVQVVGIVVAIEDYYEHHFLVTIDDSSGAILDIVLRKPKQRPNHNAPNALARPSNRATAATIADADADDPNDEETKTTIALLTTLMTLTIGTPILAKGTLTLFRNTRQLTLLRLQPLHSTSAELQHIASRTTFLASTLGKPWHLSATKQRKLRDAAESDRLQVSGRARTAAARRAEQKAWDARREDRLRLKYEEEEEVERREAAEKARRDGEEVMLRRSRRQQRMQS